jgi:hypothetical protein
MSELSSESLEASLGAAFGDAPVAPPPKAARPPEPDEQEEPAPQEGAEVDPADLESEIQEPEAKAEVEPEFEIEIEAGKPETLPLSRLKELAARGAKAGRGFEENARVREALQAHVQQVQFQQQFQQAVSQDIAQVQAIDHQLQQQFGQIDWQKEFSEDPFNAMKLKAQRDQLNEQRAAAVQNLNAKQQQFQDFSRQNVQKALAAENEALLAKVPAWRNAEKAKQEQGEIASVLTSHYGFTSQEVGSLIDHRHLLVARDAAAYRKLLANKDAKVKQAREAPATAKPGATAAPNGRAEFAKVKAKVKELGAKGNHQAQENLMARVLGATFK